MGWPTRGPDDLDADQRARIRYQVLSSLRGRKRTFGDRVMDAIALAALPAPHLMRGLAAAAIVLGVVASAPVVSAESLPDDALYPVKLAGEQMRLALALTAEDRAAVELSMAEHRLAEAEQLALAGRTGDALVATGAYGEHLANAAAALATVERLDPNAGPVVDRLRQRVAEQQTRAASVAAHLATDPGSQTAPAFRMVASVATLPTGALSISAQIADHAASVSERVADQAEDLAGGGQSPAARAAGAATLSRQGSRTPSPSSAPSGTEAPRPAGAGQPLRTPPPPATAAPRATPYETGKVTATPDRVALDAAEKARREADRAREAADRAKEASKKTASPSPTPRR